MSDQDGPLFLVVTIKPRLDRLEEAEAQLQSMRRNSLEEPGCVFMHLVQPHDDPDIWVMLEMFRSRAAWDEHMLQPYNTEGNKILEGLLRDEPGATYLPAAWLAAPDRLEERLQRKVGRRPAVLIVEDRGEESDRKSVV